MTQTIPAGGASPVVRMGGMNTNMPVSPVVEPRPRPVRLPQGRRPARIPGGPRTDAAPSPVLASDSLLTARISRILPYQARHLALRIHW